MPNPKPKRRRRRTLLVLVLLALPAALWSCFPAPIRELWPPRPGEPRHVIDVVFRDWHTVIIEPAPSAGTTASNGLLREWEFCEKAWYLEGKQGLTGVARSLFWPTASGVGCAVVPEPFWIRYPPGEVRRWTFVLSEGGLRTMNAYLEAEKGEGLAEFPGWYAGKSSYHLFYDCHHFTASALRAAGLPIRPWWAFSGWMISLQLDRVRKYHEEEVK